METKVILGVLHQIDSFLSATEVSKKMGNVINARYELHRLIDAIRLAEKYSNK